MQTPSNAQFSRKHSGLTSSTCAETFSEHAGTPSLSDGRICFHSSELLIQFRGTDSVRPFSNDLVSDVFL
jgi:hypothetical protein